eukprot:m.148887 g.148887  ORF g.148887 m.148887 type:complete len:818 (+) comp16844_c0_seq1:87-2540(+)
MERADLRHALEKARFEDRYAELYVILERMPNRDLHEILPDLLGLMFGLDKKDTRLSFVYLEDGPHKTMIDQVLRLLGPQGVLFQRLLNLDCEARDELRYDFAISLLPVATQMRIQRREIPPLFQSMLQPYAAPVNVHPNIFEYYFFLFAMVPRQKRSSGQPAICESRKMCYMVLLDLYLEYFLATPKTAAGEVQSSQCTNPAQADKVLNILQEFWLGQHSEFGEFVQDGGVTEDQTMALCDFFRQWHVFSILINAKDLTADPLHQGTFDEFRKLQKRHAVALRPKMFRFLAYLLRVGQESVSLSTTVECWMKYVCPWRYATSSYSANDWGQYVKENFLCYSHLLLLFILRISRFDFRAGGFDSRESRNLSNIPRVFSMLCETNRQTGEAVVEILREGEREFLSSSSLNRAFSFGASIRHQLYALLGPDAVYTPLFAQYTPESGKTSNIDQRVLMAKEDFKARTRALYQKILHSFEHMPPPVEEPSPSIPFGNYMHAQKAPAKDAAKQLYKHLKDALRYMKALFPFVAVLPAAGGSAAGHAGVGAGAGSHSANSSFLSPIGRTSSGNIRTPGTSPSAEPSVAGIRSSPASVTKQRQRLVERMYCTSSQPVRSYESAFLVRLFNRISASINDSWEIRPWMFPASDLGRRALGAYKAQDGAFALAPNPEQPGGYVLSVVRDNAIFTDVVTKTADGLTLDGRLKFSTIGELVQHYLLFPYHISRDMTQYTLLNVFKQNETSMNVSLLRRQVNERLLPVDLRWLASYHVHTYMVVLAVGFYLALRMFSVRTAVFLAMVVLLLHVYHALVAQAVDSKHQRKER